MLPKERSTTLMIFVLICILFICDISEGEREIFKVSSPDDVQNNPSNLTVFTLSQSSTITHIRTYHWNYGQGAIPGNILLRDQSGKSYGPWPTYGESGMGGVANSYWNAYPRADLPAGTYTVDDSDKGTWSCNANTGWRGITWVWTQD